MSKRNKSITDEMIIEMYLSGVSVNEITKKAGITPTGVGYIRKKHGIKAIRTSGQPRKHKVNENFFKVWTHEMAWVLGMFVTDGAVSKSSHSITFAQSDERILKLIAKYMESDYVLMPFGKTKTTPSIVINSKEIKMDLEMMGITHNKSMTLPFPNVPEEYLPSFIRGVIDGDGYVDKKGYVVTITTGSLSFAQGLLKVFQKWEINVKVRSAKNKNGSVIYRVVISGKNDLIRLAKIIYKNVNTDQNFIIHKRVYLSQHTEKPFIAKDRRKHKAWSITENNTILITTNNRRSLKTYISNSLIENLRHLAKIKNKSINYLIEPYMEQLVETDFKFISLKSVNDRREFRTTFDESLLNRIKAYGSENNIKMNAIIEYCMRQCLEENGLLH